MELIKIENRGGKESVNGRELHEFLGNKRQFSDWIKQRVEQYGFIEGTDYTLISQICETSSGGTVRKEYYLSLEMAKELSMVENNEKGRQARQYFIDCEKRMKNLSLEQMTLLVIEGQKKRLAQLEATLESQIPKVAFYETVAETKGLATVQEFAKTVGIGPNRLFEFLRQAGFFFKRDGSNLPYQKYINEGLFKVREEVIKGRKEREIYFRVYITGKGQTRLANLLAGRGVIHAFQ